jgi:hypothetical protein
MDTCERVPLSAAVYHWGPRKPRTDLDMAGARPMAAPTGHERMYGSGAPGRGGDAAAPTEGPIASHISLGRFPPRRDA